MRMTHLLARACLSPCGHASNTAIDGYTSPTTAAATSCCTLHNYLAALRAWCQAC